MLQISVNDKIVEVPQYFSEMSIEYFSGYWKILTKYYIEEDDSVDTKIQKETDMALELVGYLLGLTKEETKNVELEQAFEVMDVINNQLNKEKPDKYVMDCFLWNNEKYYFPSDLMESRSFGEYAEIKQIEQIYASDEANKFDHITRQIAILCRKAGEKYDSYDIDKRVKEFDGLTMNIAMAFSFFLQERMRRYNRHFQIYSEEKREAVSTND